MIPIIRFLSLSVSVLLLACAGPSEQSRPTTRPTTAPGDNAIVAPEPASVAPPEQAVAQEASDAGAIRTEAATGPVPADAATPKTVQNAQTVVAPSTDVTAPPQKTPAADPVVAQDQPKASITQSTPADTTQAPIVTPTADSAQQGAAKQGQKSPIISVEPNHFHVTIAKKTPSHPQFGVGARVGFAVDGVQGKELVTERGQTYYFDVDTSMQHDFYLSRNSVGWGGGVVTEGVKGQFTYRGIVTFSPNENTPALLYYQCRNHKGMGWKIHVTRKGEKVKLGSSRAATGQQPLSGQVQVSAKQLKQKIQYAKLVVQGSSITKRVQASKNKKAIAMLKKAAVLVAQSEQGLINNTLQEAVAAVDEALRLVTAASREVPARKTRSIAELEAEYNEASLAIKTFKASYQRTIKRAQADKSAMTVKVNLQELDRMVGEAVTLRESGKYQQANRLLHGAQQKLTQALNKMLASQTVVYELKFQTAKEEYDYEVARFVSYEELIPLAIVQKQPAQGTVNLMQQFVLKAKNIYAKADGFATKGDYKTATEGMREATKKLRNALRLVGV